MTHAEQLADRFRAAGLSDKQVRAIADALVEARPAAASPAAGEAVAARARPVADSEAPVTQADFYKHREEMAEFRGEVRGELRALGAWMKAMAFLLGVFVCPSIVYLAHSFLSLSDRVNALEAEVAILSAQVADLAEKLTALLP